MLVLNPVGKKIIHVAMLIYVQLDLERNGKWFVFLTMRQAVVGCSWQRAQTGSMVE